jgi:hypothetical protein
MNFFSPVIHIVVHMVGIGVHTMTIYCPALNFAVHTMNLVVQAMNFQGIMVNIL